jgi:Hypoxia induced protein conserved region
LWQATKVARQAFSAMLWYKGIPFMEHAVRLAVLFALAAVALVLLMGLWNMLRGGSPNLSQTLMRWRVILQFIAICIVMAAIYLSGK